MYKQSKMISDESKTSGKKTLNSTSNSIKSNNTFQLKPYTNYVKSVPENMDKEVMQKRAEVGFSKSKLKALVKCQIYIYGSGASDDKAAKMQKTIMDDWNRGFTYIDPPTSDHYSVEFDVTVEVYNKKDPSKGPDISTSLRAMAWGVKNYIYVGATSSDVDRSYVQAGFKGRWRGYGNDPSSHEFGHLIGMRDQYSDRRGARPGWKGNVMAEAAGYGVVEQKNIDALMGHMLPKYKATKNYVKNEDLTIELKESNPGW